MAWQTGLSEERKRRQKVLFEFTREAAEAKTDEERMEIINNFYQKEENQIFLYLPPIPKASKQERPPENVSPSEKTSHEEEIADKMLESRDDECVSAKTVEEDPEPQIEEKVKATQEPSNLRAKDLHPEMYQKWKDFSSRQDFNENCRQYYEEITHEPQVAPNEKVMAVKIDEDQVNAPSEPPNTPSSEITRAPFKAPEQRVQEGHQQSGPAAAKNSPPPIKVKGDHYRQGRAKHIRRPMRRKPPPWPSRLQLKRGIYSGGKMRQ